MNAPDAIADVERELSAPLSGLVDGKRRLSDALWHLRQIPIQDDRVPRTRLLIEIASRFLHQETDALSAVEPAALATMLAKDAGATSLLLQALALQGQVLFATGNVADALRVLADALRSAQSAQDLEGESNVWVALGTSFLDSALYVDARDCLKKACDLDSVIRPETVEYATACSKAAAADLCLGEFDTGLAAIRTAVAILDRPATDDEAFRRVQAEGTYVRLLLSKGLVDSAAERSGIASSLAERTSSARTNLSAALASGLVKVYAGQVDSGLQVCKTALGLSRGAPAALMEAALVNIQAYERAGRPDEALALHRELTVVLRRRQHEAIRHYSLLPTTSETDEQFRRSPPEGHIDLLEQIALISEMRDDPTGEHAYRVAKLAGILWTALGEPGYSAADVETAVRVHDIGKAAIPDALLTKVEPPTAGEREILQRHAAMGAEMIVQSFHPLRDLAADIARYHHERYDGSGYPERLEGDAIPLVARVTAVCDAYDAMTHAKPYRAAESHEDALREIQAHSGTQFDPMVVARLEPVLSELRRTNTDLNAYLGASAASAAVRVAAGRIHAALRKSDGSATLSVQNQLRQQQQRRLVR